MAARKLRVSRVLKTLQAVGGCRKAAAERLGVSLAVLDSLIQSVPIEDVWHVHLMHGPGDFTRNWLVQAYYWMAERICGSKSFSGYDRDAIRSAAGKGLIRAVETWNPTKCPTFNAYATIVMKRAIIDETRKLTTAKSCLLVPFSNDIIDLFPEKSASRQNFDRSWFYSRITGGLEFLSRVIVFLRYGCGLKVDEISRIVGIPEKKVRSTLTKSIAEIRANLNRDDANEILEASKQ